MNQVVERYNSKKKRKRFKSFHVRTTVEKENGNNKKIFKRKHRVLFTFDSCLRSWSEII